MSTLCIDIGNTNFACGVHKNGAWIQHWRIRTDPKKTIDEYSVLFRSIFEQKRISPKEIRGVCIGSVVPELNETMKKLFTELVGSPPLFVHAGIHIGLDILIDNPSELGSDLIANARAGYERAGSSVVIVDFGTALTFTCVERKGNRGAIRGVSIAPGINSALSALSANTAQLPHVQLETPSSPIGTNTIASIQSGILYGYAALVEGLTERLKRELPEPVKAIATGGTSAVFSNLVDCFDEMDSWLTLDGLRILFDQNRE